ncbi:hypothetical protein PIB30_020885 [Stylosanthes scabra]|uniref:Uncharacterized protein n=1 Tax=Stylosanthes scabra TaxID=79078 RepID=A0ABU6X633_9FABA|nr:hypothetical protein [Stylosanthes scabra]
MLLSPRSISFTHASPPSSSFSTSSHRRIAVSLSFSHSPCSVSFVLLRSNHRVLSLVAPLLPSVTLGFCAISSAYLFSLSGSGIADESTLNDCLFTNLGQDSSDDIKIPQHMRKYDGLM